jgi:hypothetical protein
VPGHLRRKRCGASQSRLDYLRFISDFLQTEWHDSTGPERDAPSSLKPPSSLALNSGSAACCRRNSTSCLLSGGSICCRVNRLAAVNATLVRLTRVLVVAKLDKNGHIFLPPQKMGVKVEMAPSAPFPPFLTMRSFR